MKELSCIFNKISVGNVKNTVFLKNLKILKFLKFGNLSLGNSYKKDSYYIKENDFECT